MKIRFMMQYIPRKLVHAMQQALERGKSILLLGPRQTGKTTAVEQQLKPSIRYSFASANTRQRYEQNPALLESELIEQIKSSISAHSPPLIFIDEIQKIPRVMDVVQYLIDSQSAQFILTGSSARKLKRGSELNLLPGRVVSLHMTPLLYEEIPEPAPALEDILLYGTLPGILREQTSEVRELDLYSYVTTYLEEEIRAEALVRKVGQFARFLEIAASECGKPLNFTRLSQDIGVSDTTIAHYYQILEDCLIVHRIDPLINSQTKRRLIKTPKYLFFDPGIRRACANEGTRLSQRVIADLFEQYIGNQLIYHAQLVSPQIKIKYWRDLAGPEVDFVLDIAHHYIPIEVKWSDKPSLTDARHLIKFSQDYEYIEQAYIICRTPTRYRITENIIALPWQEIPAIFENIAKN